MPYDEHAADLASFYNAQEPRWARELASHLTEGARILDVGSGSGRDAAYFSSQGFDVLGVEPSAEMRCESEVSFPQLKDKIFEDGLPF